MWLSEYFRRRKIQSLKVERAKLHAELVVLTKTDAYYQCSKLAGQIAAIDERLKQLEGVY